MSPARPVLQKRSGVTPPKMPDRSGGIFVGPLAPLSVTWNVLSKFQKLSRAPSRGSSEQAGPETLDQPRPFLLYSRLKWQHHKSKNE